MKRPCDVCGTEYEAKRPSSRFCGTACRTRHHRRPTATVTDLPGATQAVEDELVKSIIETLTKAERLDTWAGKQAVALASQVSAPTTTASGLAALSKELTRVMDEALKGAPAQADALDEIGKRRAQKAAGA